MPRSVARPPRSRNGCVNCRQAKIKCDEIKPLCGTCGRRRLACQGYARTRPQAPAIQASEVQTSDATRINAHTHARSHASPRIAGNVLADTSESSVWRVCTPRATSSPDCSPSSPETAPSPRVPSPGSSLALIPPGIVSTADQPNIDLYFSRHPYELVMGDEFVVEMNANTLLLLQQDPATVADALAAIGYAYQVGDSAGSGMLVLNRRARILANLRLMKPSSVYFEMALHLLLLLCAMELVTFAQPRHTTTIPTLLANVSYLISHRFSTGGDVSFVSRYFLRGLARQDLVVSLVNLRRFRVPTASWYDPREETRPDRVLGCTLTLMPLLEELCALAEDFRDHILQPCPSRGPVDHDSAETTGEISGDGTSSSLATGGTSQLWIGEDYTPSSIPSTFNQRADSLKERLSSWKPPIVGTAPFRSTRKFRAQAACYRVGALLYLQRLLHPPLPSHKAASGPLSAALPPLNTEMLVVPINSTEAAGDSSYLPHSHLSAETEAEAEAEALSMAHDILFYASSLPPAEMKLLLWPVFLASCEMNDQEDRASILNIFDFISNHRKTITVTKTRAFVEDRVWRARDAGEEWNWMVLAQKHPEDCLPI